MLVALTFALSGLGVTPVHADGDPPPLLPPPGVSDPGAGASVPAGPTYEITPGVGGSKLPPPSDPKVAAHHAKVAAKKAKTPRRSAPVTSTSRESVAPATALRPVTASTTREDLAWEVGAGALLLLVLTDLGRVGLRRRPRPSTP